VAQRLPRHVNGVAAADSCGAKETAAVIKTKALLAEREKKNKKKTRAGVLPRARDI
jgi:hypothetical protein